MRVGVVGEAAQLRERVIDVAAAIGGHQRGIAGLGGGDADFLGAPVQIGADRVGREHHEASACRRARCTGSWRGRCGRSRCRTETAIGRLRPSASDRQPRLGDEADAVAQRVQSLDAGDVVHQAKGVAVDVELAAFKPRPAVHAGARRASARTARSSTRRPACRSDRRCRSSGRTAAAARR